MLSEREKDIGQRLRAFRDALQISRSKFAVSCGFGSERIASYESGRAPLPYEVFRAISKRFFLSPFWLALGDAGGSPRLSAPFDDGDFIQRLPARSLFSLAFDEFIACTLEGERLAGKAIAEEKRLRLQKISSDLTAGVVHEKLIEEIGQLKVWADKVKEDLDFRAEVAQRLANQKKDLTNPLTSSNIADVKLMWPALKRRLQSATAETGKKSELAKALDLDLTRVSQWLTDGKSAREPGAEYALRLLHWVEQQECRK